MQRYAVIFSILMGIAIFLGFDGFSIVGGILLIMVTLAGFFHIFSKRASSQLIETSIILLLGPLVVFGVIQFLLKILHDLLLSMGITTNPTSFSIIIIIMLLAFGFVMWERRNSRRIDRFRLRGSEREPIIPEAYDGNYMDEEMY